MANQQLSISLSRPSPEDGDQPILILEKDEGKVAESKGITKAAMVDAVLGFIDPNRSSVLADKCWSGGWWTDLSETVFVYLSDDTLNYKMGCSYGVIGNPHVEIIEYTQNINTDLEEFKRFKYPSMSVVDHVWKGAAYTNVGDVVPHPEPTFNDEGVHFSSKVYSTLKVTYKVKRYRYSVKVYSLPEALQDQYTDTYSSVVYAYWDGGVTWVILELSHDAGYGALCGGSLGGPGSSSVDITGPDDEYKPPKADPKDTRTVIDYCSQEVKGEG